METAPFSKRGRKADLVTSRSPVARGAFTAAAILAMASVFSGRQASSTKRG
jgi:hypothetical protein